MPSPLLLMSLHRIGIRIEGSAQDLNVPMISLAPETDGSVLTGAPPHNRPGTVGVAVSRSFTVAALDVVERAPATSIQGCLLEAPSM